MNTKQCNSPNYAAHNQQKINAQTVEYLVAKFNQTNP